MSSVADSELTYLEGALNTTGSLNDLRRQFYDSLVAADLSGSSLADCHMAFLEQETASTGSLADLEWDYYTGLSGLTPAEDYALTDHMLAVFDAGYQEATVNFEVRTFSEHTAGAAYSGGNDTKGVKFLCTADCTINQFQIKTNPVNARQYDAFLFARGGASTLGAQVGTTATVVSPNGTAGAFLEFTPTDWIITAGTEYLIMVRDNTEIAMAGYYVGAPDWMLGFPLAIGPDNASAYADATGLAASAAFTSDTDVYAVIIGGTV